MTRRNNAGSDGPDHEFHRSGYGLGSTGAGEGHSVRGRGRFSESLKQYVRSGAFEGHLEITWARIRGGAFEHPGEQVGEGIDVAL